MAVIDRDRKQMKVKRNDSARVCVFISKCLRRDLGHKVHLPVLNMDVEKAKKVQTKLVLDAKQEAENGSKIDNGRSKSCSTVVQSDIYPLTNCQGCHIKVLWAGTLWAGTL